MLGLWRRSEPMFFFATLVEQLVFKVRHVSVCACESEEGEGERGRITPEDYARGKAWDCLRIGMSAGWVILAPVLRRGGGGGVTSAVRLERPHLSLFYFEPTDSTKWRS